MLFTPEQKIILLSVKIEPKAEDLEQLNASVLEVKDWDVLVRLVIERGLGPLLFKKIKLLPNYSLIPPTVITKLQQVYFYNLSRGMLMQNCFKTIAKKFAEQQLPLIALKGIYLSEWLYKDIALRQCSDIDLLIHPADGQKCINALYALGYRAADSKESDFVVKIKSESIHYTPMVLNGVSIELHTHSHCKTEKYNMEVDALWRNAQPIENSNALALEYYDLLIHICVHLDKHFQAGKIQLNGFADIVNLLEYKKSNFDWEEFIHRCEAYSAIKEVFRYILLSAKYLNASVPDVIVQSYSNELNTHYETLFHRFILGDFEPFTAVPFHSANLKNIDSLSGKIKYVWDIVFPSKEFMIQKYNPQPLKGSKSPPLGDRGLWWLWYPYRWYTALKGLYYMMKKKIRN